MLINSQIIRWTRRVFELSAEAEVSVIQEGGATVLTLPRGERRATYTIPKFLHRVSYNDVFNLRADGLGVARPKRPVLAFFFRFFGAWISFAALYGAFSVCPFCGQPGCPVGAGSMGLIGGVFAMLVSNWRSLWQNLKERFFRRRNRAGN
jgi:hypothetical protein